MSQLNHQFIIRLVASFQDRSRVYLLLRLVQGGELFQLIHQEYHNGIAEKDAKFYAGGILEALTYMHRRNIIYRDLKPENVLIGSDGYPIIIDLGFAKVIENKTYTLCGTPLYIAPEVILNRGHDMAADHFSFGCLIYEMVVGQTPFYEDGVDQISLFKSIARGEYPDPHPGLMSEAGRDICRGLLQTDPSHRLGSLSDGFKGIFRHAWFDDLDFGKLRAKEVKAPWTPEVKDALDGSCFDDWSHLDDKGKQRYPAISREENALFKAFN